MKDYSNEEIFFEVQGNAGIITLNRPKFLNAVTHDQIKRLRLTLEYWRELSEVKHVIICANGEKAFSAGGDVLHVYEARDRVDQELIDFFRDEYSLNSYIKHYPKPYIAMIDGIVMGGGVGISIHGRYRVGSERMVFAMPEVGIGFFPDVGGTYLLSRIPKNIGVYCALTGARLKLADAVHTGIISHPVQGTDFPKIQEELVESDDVEEILQKYYLEPGSGELAEKEDVIETVFGGSSVLEVIDTLNKLEEVHRDWADKTVTTMKKNSPTSVEIAFEQMKRGASLDFNDCMKLEFRIVSQMLRGREFFEGIRALLIDKDNQPNWRTYRSDAEKKASVEKYFTEPEHGDLDLT